MNNAASQIHHRRVARGLILTPDQHVLLMRMAFPWVDEPVWIAPGGGLKPEESWEAAVERELLEETGLRTGAVGPQLWERTFDIDFGGQVTRLHERYFLIRAERFEPDVAAHEADERRWFRGFHWWPLSSIANDATVDSGRTLRAVLTEAL